MNLLMEENAGRNGSRRFLCHLPGIFPKKLVWPISPVGCSRPCGREAGVTVEITTAPSPFAPNVNAMRNRTIKICIKY